MMLKVDQIFSVGFGDINRKYIYELLNNITKMYKLKVTIYRQFEFI